MNIPKEVEEVLARLGKKTRERVSAATEVKVEKLPTASVGLNRGLAGGIGYGRQTIIWGNKSAGKSSLVLSTIGLAQREGKIAAWIDAEHSYDPAWAEKMGVDSSRLIHSPVKTIADMVDVGTDLMRAGVDIIGVDSISSLLPSSYFEKDASSELKGLDGTKQIGSEARDLANGVKMLNYSNKNTALILISQIRNKITTYGAMHQPTGGHAVMFFSSTSIKLWSSAREADQITGNIQSGDKVFSEALGRPVTWTVDFNKLGAPGQSGSYDFYYKGANVGIDNVGEALDIAERYGIVQRTGSWYNVYGEKIQGRQKVLGWLNENSEFKNKLVEEVSSI